MMRSLVLLACCVFTIAACDKPSGAPAPAVTTSASPNEAGVAPDPDTEALFVEFHDSLITQIQSDARTLSARRLASRADGDASLRALTPGAVKPRPEFAGPKVKAASSKDPAAFGQRMADFARRHPEVVARETKRINTIVEPELKAALDNVDKQFPAGGNASDAASPPSDAGMPDASRGK